MLTICSNRNVEIENGQILRDFTCFNNKEASAMNYLVLSRFTVNNVTDFIVLSPNFNSEHETVTAYFTSSFVKVEKGKVLDHPNRYKWDSQDATICHSLLNQKIFRRN